MKDSSRLLISKIQVIVLIVTISMLFIVGTYLFFPAESESIRRSKHREIQTIAEMKIEQISRWQKERAADATVISQSRFFKKKIKEWIGHRSNKKLKAELSERLSLIKNNYDYENIFIASPDGKLLLTLDKKFLKIENIVLSKIKEESKSGRIIFTDLYFSDTDNKIYYDIIAPMVEGNETVLAVLVIRIEPGLMLFPLIKSWPTPSLTSESFIFKKNVDSVLYLSELHKFKNGRLNLSIPLSRRDVPEVQAALGNKGIYEGKNYKGDTEILSYIAPVPGTDWFLAAQISQGEVYRELYLRSFTIIAFTLGLLLIIGGGLILIYRTRQRNIYRELFAIERELREHHEEFKAILYSIADGVITADNKGRIKQMNRTAEELTGWTEKEAEGKPFQMVIKILDERSRKSVHSSIAKVLSERIIAKSENPIVLISKDGTETPITETCAPFLGRPGNDDGIVLLFRDVTKETYYEKIIRQSEARLRKAEHVTMAGHWEFHPESGEMIVSEGAAKIYGLNGTQWDVSEIQKYALPEYRNKLDEALSNLINAGKPLDVEFKIKKADSGEVVDIHSIAEYDNAKNIVFGIVRDISKSKQFESALINSEKKYKTLVEDLKVGIYYIDFNGTFLFGNKAAEEITGYHVGELVGKSILEIKLLDTKQKIKAALLLGKNMLGKSTGPDEFTFHKQDGTQRIVEISTSVMIVDSQKVVCGIVLDITERKQAEGALKLSEKKYRYLFEHNPQPMWTYDQYSLKFLEVNEAAVLHYGYSRNDFLKMTLKDIRPKEDVDALMAEVSVKSGATNRSGVWRHKKKNGEIIFVETTSHLIKFEEKNARLILVHDVTERNRAEEELRIAKDFAENLIQTANAMVVGLDLNGNITIYNKAAENITGYTREELEGHNWFDLLVPEERYPSVRGEFEKLLKKGLAKNFENPILTKSGEERYIAWQNNEVYEGDQISGSISFGLDITPRRHAEESMRESDEFNKSLLGAIPFGMNIIDETGNIIFVSDKLKDLLGEDVIGKKCWTVYREDKTQCKNCPLNANVARGKTVVIESENILNGKIFQISHTGMVYKGERAVLEIFQDITERKNTEQTFNLLAQAVRSTSDSISLTDINNNIIFVNESFLKTYKYEEKELIGKNIEIVRAFNNPEYSSETIKNASINGGWFGELLNKRNDGSVFPISLSTSAVLNEKGEPFALIGIARDITDQKMAEQELKKYRNHLEDLVDSRTHELDRINKKLQMEIEREKEIEVILQYSLEREKELNELKTRFISMASHEFRTPLTSIFSSAELIKRYGKKWSEDKFNEHADKIMSSIEYLTDLLDDVLTISRSESGKIVFNPVKIDLHIFCWDIIEELKFNVDKNHKLIFKYTAEKEFFELDPKLIRFILTNLISNAFKYSPKGTDVELLVFSTKDDLEINVKDQGIGIPEEDRAHLFEPFYRTKNVGEIEGTGLGLSIVKKAVDLHNGIIDYQTELGRGTTFKVKLPRRTNE